MSIYDTVIDALHHALWTVAPVAIGLAALLISYICAQWARPLGGLIYTIFTLPIMIPKLGRAYNAIFINMLHISFLSKLVGFIVSASGVLIPITILQLFFPDYATYPPILWGVLISSILVTLQIMHSAHLMEIPNFHDHAHLASKLLKVDFHSIDRYDLMRISRAHFIDLTIINIFIIVICYAVTVFCGKTLSLFGEYPSSLTDEVSSAFTFLQYFVASPLELKGQFGYIVRIFYGASMFVYMVFFISLAPTLIDVKESDATPQPLISPDIINEILKHTASSPLHSNREDR